MDEKMTKQELEDEYLDFIERTIGFVLQPWQRGVLLDLREATRRGVHVDFDNIQIMRDLKR